MLVARRVLHLIPQPFHRVVFRTVGGQAQQLERDGALRSRRLGALGSVDSVGTTEVETEEDEPEEKTKEKE